MKRTAACKGQVPFCSIYIINEEKGQGRGEGGRGEEGEGEVVVKNHLILGKL